MLRCGAFVCDTRRSSARMFQVDIVAMRVQLLRNHAYLRVAVHVAVPCAPWHLDILCDRAGGRQAPETRGRKTPKTGDGATDHETPDGPTLAPDPTVPSATAPARQLQACHEVTVVHHGRGVQRDAPTVPTSTPAIAGPDSASVRIYSCTVCEQPLPRVRRWNLLTACVHVNLPDACD